MSSRIVPAFFTSAILDRIPGFFHGFGTRRFDACALSRHRRGRRFRLVTLDQVHSDTIRFFDRPTRRRRRGDALVTARPDLLLAVKTADCLPLLLADPEKRVVAAVHCGWRGTAQRIAERTVRSLQDRYGCKPSDLRAGLGPRIGARCYEVGEDVRRALRESGLPVRFFRARRGRPGKYSFDLAAANVFQLKRAGLKDRHIDRIDLCTHCRPDLCSYRRDPLHPGRMINFIGYSKP